MSAAGFARTPEPPYYAVIDSSDAAVDRGEGIAGAVACERAAQLLSVATRRRLLNSHSRGDYWLSRRRTLVFGPDQTFPG